MKVVFACKTNAIDDGSLKAIRTDSTVAGSAIDRKISFAVLGASERSDSLHSSTTSISQADGGAAADGKGKSRCENRISFN